MKTSKIKDKSTHQMIKEYLAEKNRQDSLIWRVYRIGMPVVAILLISVAIGSALLKKDVIKPGVNEQNAFAQGLIKSMGGRIVSIDARKREFIVTPNWLVGTQHYTITVQKDTDFMMRRFLNPDTPVRRSGVVGEDESIPVALPLEPSSFEMLHNGMDVEVQFQERLNVDTIGILAAKRVVIVKDDDAQNQ